MPLPEPELPLEFEHVAENYSLQKPAALRRLEFPVNWNQKLFSLNFIAILPQSSSFKIEEMLDLRIGERFFCYATVLNIKSFKLVDVIGMGYHLLDRGLGRNEFMKSMEDEYGKRQWWNGDETIMKILFIQKYVQTKMDF